MTSHSRITFPLSAKPIAAMTEKDRRQMLDDVFRRALNDERLDDIAKDYGVSRSGLNYAVLKYAGDEWRDVQATRALSSLQAAEERLEQAKSQLELSIAVERLKSAQWQLEKLMRRWFGRQIDEPSSAVTITLNIGEVTSG